MLTAEENELLSRIGPGTPCGELLRRYWQPVCAVANLTDEQPKKRIRLLCDQLRRKIVIKLIESHRTVPWPRLPTIKISSGAVRASLFSADLFGAERPRRG